MHKINLTIAVTLCCLLAACSMFTPRRGFNRLLIDNNIKLTAQRALDNDPQLAGKTHIGVDVYNGVLLLIGAASIEPLKQRAEADVTGYDGIRRVVNLIDVMPPQPAGRTALDASLTARVKTALLGVDVRGFDPGRVNISTAHGKVYLMGLVSHAEAAAVIKIARNVAGVVEVVQVFEYTD